MNPLTFRKKLTDRAPWADDPSGEAVVPPGVSVTVCPPSPAPTHTGRPARPSDRPQWSPDKGFFSDKGEIDDSL